MNSSNQLSDNFLQYLTESFPNSKYKNKSLIDLYTFDEKFFNTLKKKNLITNDALSFFNKKGANLKNAANISIDAFKRLEYERIINDYITGFTSQNRTNKINTSPTDNVHQSVSSQKVVIQPKHSLVKERSLHCCKDMTTLTKIGDKIVTVVGKKECIRFPIYGCSQCHRKYTSLSNYKDLAQMNLKGTVYVNIRLENDNVRYERYCNRPRPVEPGSKCLVHANQVNLRVCPKCDTALKITKHTFITNNRNPSAECMFINAKDNTSIYVTKYCPKCHINYINYKEYLCHQKEWILLNPEAIPKLQNLLKREQKAQKKAKEEALKKEQEKRCQRLQELQEKQLKEKRERERNREKALRKAERLKEKNKAKRILEQKAQTNQDSLQKNVKEILYQHDNNIRVKDFVVRRSTFKCLHEKHHIQNVDATLKIIDRNGEIINARVPAGYCPNCNIFFILESTYQYLKTRGTPICRISDEKTYLKTSSFYNDMKLAQESLLMQYGYNVSQTEGLTSMRRRKILAVLVDNDILTRSDIISYLDFFINQRKYQHKFEKAIEKWEEDRDFISRYKAGSYAEYGVKGIYRKS